MYHESHWKMKENLIRKNTLLPITQYFLNSPFKSFSLWSRRLIFFKREVKRTQRIFLIWALPKAQYGCTFIHWFTNIYLHLQCVVGSGKTAMNKTDKNLYMIFVLLWAGVISNEISKIYTIPGGSWCDGEGESSGQDYKVVIWGVTSELTAHMEIRALGMTGVLVVLGSWTHPGVWVKQEEISPKCLKLMRRVRLWLLARKVSGCFQRTQSSGSLLYQCCGM